MTDIPEQTSPAAELAGSLATRLGEAWQVPVRVSNLRQLPGGASRETWLFDAHVPEQPSAGLILRRDPPGSPRPDNMAREAAALAAAAHAGVPVPRLYDHGSGERLLRTPYLIMERLDGETIPRRLLRDERWAAARAGLARELGRILARIHTIPVRAVPGLDGGDPLEQLATHYEGFGEPRPALDIGFRWLERHRPAPTTEHVVHGDFRNGNLLIGPGGVRGVLDWELVHRGDPHEDLGWLCVKAWRFGAAAPVGGFGSRVELLDGYAEAGGTRLDPEVVRWWEVYGTLRWALLCRSQAERHLSGAEPSVELAALGRRVCEQEHDLLLALGLTEPQHVHDPLDGAAEQRPSAALHDRPDPGEILDAVRHYLTTELTSTADDRARFHAKVAANALGIAQRELLLGESQRQAHQQRLAGLGCASDAELSRAIRDGSLDGRWAEVTAAVRAAVTDKLLVANPGYLAQPG